MLRAVTALDCVLFYKNLHCSHAPPLNDLSTHDVYTGVLLSFV